MIKDNSYRIITLKKEKEYYTIDDMINEFSKDNFNEREILKSGLTLVFPDEEMTISCGLEKTSIKESEFFILDNCSDHKIYLSNYLKNGFYLFISKNRLNAYIDFLKGFYERNQNKKNPFIFDEINIFDLNIDILKEKFRNRKFSLDKDMEVLILKRRNIVQLDLALEIPFIRDAFAIELCTDIIKRILMKEKDKKK